MRCAISVLLNCACCADESDPQASSRTFLNSSIVSGSNEAPLVSNRRSSRKNDMRRQLNVRPFVLERLCDVRHINAILRRFCGMTGCAVGTQGIVSGCRAAYLLPPHCLRHNVAPWAETKAASRKAGPFGRYLRSACERRDLFARIIRMHRRVAGTVRADEQRSGCGRSRNPF